MVLAYSAELARRLERTHGSRWRRLSDWSGRAIRWVRASGAGSRQAVRSIFSERAEFPTLRNSSLRTLAVTVLPIPLASRAAATACAAVQPTAPLFRRWRPAGLAAPGPRSAFAGSSGTR
jgi:hypothetical protein